MEARPKPDQAGAEGPAKRDLSTMPMVGVGFDAIS